jgi:hypothetical protein
MAPTAEELLRLAQHGVGLVIDGHKYNRQDLIHLASVTAQAGATLHILNASTLGQDELVDIASAGRRERGTNSVRFDFSE